MSLSKQFVELLPILDSSEIEIILLCTENWNSSIPRIRKFEFDSFVDEFCFVNFRFYKNDIYRLKRALNFNGVIICGNGVRVGALEALCITLRRLSYPNRYVDLMKLFPRTRCELSRIFNESIRRIMRSHGGHVSLEHPYLTLERIESFATAISNKGSPYKRCIGFLDGTVRPMCRPRINQRDYYNGHKRVHALKFQSVMMPDGLVSSMFGPIDGRRHDSFLLQQSGIIAILQQKFNNGHAFYLYGDPAYPLSEQVMVPFKGHNLTQVQQLCNRKMSKVRESVEWGFGKIIQIFAFLDFKKNLKFGLQPISLYYSLATLLTNCHTCIYGCQTSEYFGLDPPTLEEYLY